jgi:outer membrane cobalamin receptor
LTGEATTVVAGKNEITRGNARLKPESSLTWDVGGEWQSGPWFVDATLFDTRVRDKIARDGGTQIDPNNKVFTYINATSARMQGLELEARWQASPMWRVSAGGTQFFHARQQVGSAWEDVNNVAKRTVRLALDADAGAWTGRIGVRSVGRTKDQDYVNGSGQQVQYSGYAVWDVSARYAVDRQQSVAVSVDNLRNRFYAEKYGFPQPGRNLKVGYRHAF